MTPERGRIDLQDSEYLAQLAFIMQNTGKTSWMKHCLTLVGFNMSLFWTVLGWRQGPPENQVGALKSTQWTPPPTQLTSDMLDWSGLTVSGCSSCALPVLSVCSARFRWLLRPDFTTLLQNVFFFFNSTVKSLAFSSPARFLTPSRHTTADRPEEGSTTNNCSGFLLLPNKCPRWEHYAPESGWDALIQSSKPTWRHVIYHTSCYITHHVTSHIMLSWRYVYVSGGSGK